MCRDLEVLAVTGPQMGSCPAGVCAFRKFFRLLLSPEPIFPNKSENAPYYLCANCLETSRLGSGISESRLSRYRVAEMTAILTVQDSKTLLPPRQRIQACGKGTRTSELTLASILTKPGNSQKPGHG